MSGWRAALAAACIVAGFPAAAQTPVPPAIPSGPVRSAVAAASLVIEVVDAEGRAVPGAVVEVGALEGEQRMTLTTDERGRIRLPSIPAGTYEVEARLEGFSASSESISLAPGGSRSLRLALGGPVPSGVGSGGTAARPSVEVVSLATADELAVQSLLAARADDGWQLSSTLPQENGSSLFVFYRSAGSPACLTQVVGGQVEVDELARRLTLVRSLRLRGAHRLAADRLALVLCEE